MIVKPTQELFLKEDSQTLTQASSQLTTDNASINECKQDPMIEDEAKKEQNKIKYRKLKQKLSNMGFNHDDKCVVNKDFSSPKKQRIMKLALDFEKMIKIQNRDYQALQIMAREIYKIVQIKNELDLQLLRQSRFIPALFELLQKVPSLHKAQFNHLLRGMEICKKHGFRIMHSFATMAVNRQYLILTNRLNGLVSFTSWIIARDEKKPIVSRAHLNICCLSFKLVNLLLLHKSKEEDIVIITNTTVQLINCSPIFKKIKIVLTEQFYQDETLQETETIQEILRFILYVIRRSQLKLQPVYSLIRPHQQTSNQNQLLFETKLISNPLSKLIQYLLPFFMGYFNQLQQTQQPIETQLIPQSYPIVVESIMGLVIKLMNSCFEVSFITAKRFFVDINKQNCLFSLFLDKIRCIIIYCKRQMEEEYNNTSVSKNLLNEIIILLGHLALDDQAVQRKIYDSVILEQIFNLPVQYIMDSYLRDIYIPTFCSLIFDNKVNLNLLLKDNSPQPIIKILKKQMMSRPSMTRKASTSSLVSYAIVSNEYNSPNYEIQRLALEMRFPVIYWQSLCTQLQKHV